MKIVGIMGSARKKGNTAFLLEKVMSGIIEDEDESIVYYPNEMNIRGCQACDACKKTGRCILPDDMQEIYRAINEADILLLASPVYMWAMSAQLKLVVDRLYAYLAADYKSLLAKPVRLGLLFTQHRETADAFMPYFHSVAGILQVIGFDPVPDVWVGTGLHEFGQAEKNSAMVASAVEYGRKLR